MGCLVWVVMQRSGCVCNVLWKNLMCFIKTCFSIHNKHPIGCQSGQTIRCVVSGFQKFHFVIMSTASQITSVSIVYSAICSGPDQRKHQSSVSLAFLRPPHKGPVMQKMLPFDDVIMDNLILHCPSLCPYNALGAIHSRCCPSVMSVVVMKTFMPWCREYEEDLHNGLLYLAHETHVLAPHGWRLSSS